MLVNSCCVCHYQIFVTVFVYTEEVSLVSCVCNCSVSTSSFDVEDLLHFLHSAGSVAEFHLVEGLGSVEAVSVAGSHLVGVSVLLGAPTGTVPVLSVHGVPGSEGVELGLLEMGVLTESGLSLHGSVVERLRVLEPDRVVSSSEGRLSENVGLGMGVAGSGGVVILRVVVGVSQMFGLRPVSATSGLTGVIGLGNESVVESSGRESIFSRIDDSLSENTS